MDFGVFFFANYYLKLEETDNAFSSKKYMQMDNS